MTFVTVFRRVPKPITGMIGILYGAEFEKFQANLDWLETTGVLVEQFDPSTARDEVAKRPAVRQILSDDGEQALPVILVNEAVVSRGRYLSRAQLARAVGQGQGWERSAA
jgi:arsenical resistance operon trans-acting repressor ArsD